jgi:hypothetical protein
MTVKKEQGSARVVSSSNGVSDSSLEPLFDGKWWPWVVTYLTSLLIN